MLKIANELFRDGKYDEAIRLYENLLSDEVCASFAYQNLALLYQKIGNTEKANLAKDESIKIKGYNEKIVKVSLECSKKPSGKGEVNTLKCAGASDYWLQHIKNDLNLSWFLTMAKKTRSLGSRDLLSLAATNGHYNYNMLVCNLESYRAAPFRAKVKKVISDKVIKKYWLELARLIFAQNSLAFDKLNAKTMYDIYCNKFGYGSISEVDVSYYSMLAKELGHFKTARDILSASNPKSNERKLNHRLLSLNTILLNSKTGREQWLSRINREYDKFGVSGIQLKDRLQKPFYNLKSIVKDKVFVDAVKLSVLMPVYEPDESTLVAIDSILNQSWENLELIIVDDASPRTDKVVEVLDAISEICKKDARAKIIFSEVNKGAYWVRNVAYQHAEGKYVTVADKDDWHHPDKYKLQIEDLERNDTKIANMVNWARVNEDLEFLIRWGPDRVAHPSFASLMFRHSQVKKDLGFWDCVRKSADGEFKMRLQKYYNIKLQPIMEIPLAFSLMSDGNLTSQDLGMGFESNDRLAYRANFEFWHNSNDNMFMEFPPNKRHFCAPKSFLPNKTLEVPQYDVVFLSEFGFEAGNKTILLNEINCCLKLGLKVGVIMHQNFLIKSAAVRHTTQEFQKLLDEGAIDRISIHDSASSKLMIIRWPTIMQYVGVDKSRLMVDNIVVIANHAPYDEIDGRRSYDIFQVTENVEYLFGKTPTWTPESEQILDIIKPMTPGEILDIRPWKGTLLGSANKHKFTNFQKKPVIGRHARDSVAKWPAEREVFRNIYPVNNKFKVSILGGAKTPVSLGFVTKDEIKNWSVHSFNSISSQEYLSGLDFFVYYHHPDMVEAFGMAILEALKEGCVCVLPENFSRVFKDAAIYCKPQDVQSMIEKIWSNPSEFKKQQELGWSFFEKHGSIESFKRYLSRYIDIVN